MRRHLCFASNGLEERFRRLVTDSKEEIGGWFLLGWTQNHGISWQHLKRLGRTPAYVIEHIIVAPNYAKKPEGKWSAWDMKKALDLAKVTARFYGGWLVHFHTHPAGVRGKPSDADVAFWQAQGEGGAASFGCIVTDRPLRLWPWDLRVDLAASPEATTVTRECGTFLSWRSRMLKEAKR